MQDKLSVKDLGAFYFCGARAHSVLSHAERETKVGEDSRLIPENMGPSQKAQASRPYNLRQMLE